MDKKLSKIIKEWKDEAGLGHNDIILASLSYNYMLKICTSKPGQMIGKGGMLFDKYDSKIKEINKSIKMIDFVETDQWYIR